MKIEIEKVPLFLGRGAVSKTADILEFNPATPSEPEPADTEISDKVPKITDLPMRKESASDILNALYEAKREMADFDARAKREDEGQRQTTISIVWKIINFHSRYVVKPNKSRKGEITGFEYQPQLQRELDTKQRGRKVKLTTNPLLPLSKLLLEDVPCEKSTRYVRDGKNAECAFYAITQNLSEGEFRADVEKHHGRDKYASMAARARRGARPDSLSKGCTLTTLEAKKLDIMLASQTPAGEVSNVDSPAPSWGWIKSDSEKQCTIIPLPAACTGEITRAILRVLKKHRQQK